LRKQKAIIFARVSSDSQSFDRQVDDLMKIALIQNLEIVATITEKVSGGKRNKERRGVQELLNQIKSLKVQKVLVSEVSRLGRNTMETLRLVEEIHDNGVCIHLADLGMDTLDESGKQNLHAEIVLHMLSLFAKDWRRNHSDRVRSGQKRAKEVGVKFGRPKQAESKDEFLAKHREVALSFERGEILSIRKRARLYGKSPQTIQKIQRLIFLLKNVSN